ncbi:GNAT family N-acetyltransferase [Aurantibacter crassamenti]|uniref:GNAT family N-acetyltransferase n=1 Tax=Aurantibacter crassamenti TaxID=1837375 RepID=UPI00193A7A0F|nr:GNAT family N-acetyltransferase [Aurantibacter crassamenti]MBM1105660.1 GNAT family N-acetyltransferase [Aurantibacter crassamenti]
MFTYRKANFKDAESIARLHALSWQQNYRGIFSDNFLDVEVVEDRLSAWRLRFENSAENQFVHVVVDEDVVVGFVCAYFDKDATYGTLVDNLHVHSDYAGQRIGENLLVAVAREIMQNQVKQEMYLWVLAQNKRAIKFYERAGGNAVETINDFDIGDREITKTRYHWSNLKIFEKN